MAAVTSHRAKPQRVNFAELGPPRGAMTADAASVVVMLHDAIADAGLVLGHGAADLDHHTCPRRGSRGSHRVGPASGQEPLVPRQCGRLETRLLSQLLLFGCGQGGQVSAQVSSTDEFLVSSQLVGRPLGQQVTVRNDVSPVGNVKRQMHMLFDQEDSGSFVSEAANDGQH